MRRRSSEMPKTYPAHHIAVLDVLKANECISNYSIEGEDVRLDWKKDGFTRAFEEFKANPGSPFGIRTREEMVVFAGVLAKKDAKGKINDFLNSAMKER